MVSPGLSSLPSKALGCWTPLLFILKCVSKWNFKMWTLKTNNWRQIKKKNHIKFIKTSQYFGASLAMLMVSDCCHCCASKLSPVFERCCLPVGWYRLKASSNQIILKRGGGGRVKPFLSTLIIATAWVLEINRKQNWDGKWKLLMQQVIELAA